MCKIVVSNVKETHTRNVYIKKKIYILKKESLPANLFAKTSERFLKKYIRHTHNC